MPIVGFGGRTVNTPRLFAARASEDFDMRVFNDGDYVRAIERKIASETISKVLYPPDAIESGRELRLTQEYFLAAAPCAISSAATAPRHSTFDRFADKVAVQLNDSASRAGRARIDASVRRRGGASMGTCGRLPNARSATPTHAAARGAGEAASLADGAAAAVICRSSTRSTRARSRRKPGRASNT